MFPLYISVNPYNNVIAPSQRFIDCYEKKKAVLGQLFG